MIKVSKDYDRCPDVLRHDSASIRIDRLLEEGNKHVFNTGVYRHKTVLDALKNIYRGKCGYCESRSEATAALQVEHYRPKNRVLGTDGHSGYYWLGYEWSNLLLVCSKCNRAKSNCFPISGTRLERPPTERDNWRCDSEINQAERPLLLNPEQDDPSVHLTFSAEGLVLAVNDDPRGEATISACQLNREPLLLARLTKANGIRELFFKTTFGLVAYWNAKDEKKPETLV